MGPALEPRGLGTGSGNGLCEGLRRCAPGAPSFGLGGLAKRVLAKS